MLHLCLEYWSGRWDSNPRPSPWQGDALPLSHFRSINSLKGAEGQTRTVDTGIFSAVLYHLSYLGSSDYYQICAYVLSRR